MKPFVHLHLHTEYSLLDGAAKISKLFAACKERNMPAIAMTDHGNLYGAVRFVRSIAKANKEEEEKAAAEGREPFKVKAILGCEFYCCNDMLVKTGKPDVGHLILLAKDQKGYTNLVQLNSIAFCDGFYYKPRIDYKTLAKHSEGLICLSGCLGGHIQENLLNGFDDEAKKLALELKAMFAPGDFYIELQNHDMPEQAAILNKQIALAKEIDVKVVATNDVHYVNRSEAEMQDVMMCVQTGKRQSDVDRMKMPNDEFYIKTYDEMHKKFEFCPEALDETLKIAERCNATVQFGLPLSPQYQVAEGTRPIELLSKLVWQGANKKYGEITEQLKARIEHELAIIDRLGYSDYFLIVHDFCKKCAELDIPVGPGRGSAAGSVVSYTLDITKVEPLKYDLLFERFLNPDRVSPPDIDLDFCFDRRGEVIDYVTQKYGRDKVCQIITFGTLAAKAAIKDVARVLSVPFDEVNKITKSMPDLKAIGKDPLRKIFGGVDIVLDKSNEKFIVPELKELYDTNPTIARVVRLAIRLEGMPRHTGIHAAGVVICREKISNFVPLSKSGNDVTTQFDMREIEDIGMLKMDFLGLKTLTDIKRTTDLIKRIHGVEIDFYAKDFKYDDSEVFKLITSGNTDAIFQIESGGMKRFMKELKPDCMEDLIAGIAMYRPGPMDDIPRFVESKHNPSKIKYDHPRLEPILAPTYGVIVYQEQVMRIVQELAGYSLPQADDVRKMMGKKLQDKLTKERKTFVDGRDDAKHPIPGAVKMGIDRELAETLFGKMEKFGSYAFNKSHSAVYAYIAYQTAYLKRYYEVEFIASVLNNRIENSDEIEKYMLYANREGIKILPPSINKSGIYFEPEGKSAIRFGLAALKNVGISVVSELIKKREAAGGKFNDIVHLIESLEGNCLNKRFLESMILSGACDEFGVHRSQLMEVYAEVIERSASARKNRESGQVNFFDSLGDDVFAGGSSINYPNISEYKNAVRLKYEKEVVGAYISGHPLDAHIARFDAFSLTGDMLKPLEENDDDADEGEASTETARYDKSLENGKAVSCGGIVVEFKKVITKQSGKEMAFAKLEDLKGQIEFMLFPAIYEKLKNKIAVDTLLTVYGKISVRGDEAPIVLADRVEFWEELKEQAEQLEAEGLPPKSEKILCLKYSTLDFVLSGKIMDILRSHAGDCVVKVRCAETGSAITLNECVDINDVLITELKGLLPKENIFIKEKEN